jgi:hypothetical protein
MRWLERVPLTVMLGLVLALPINQPAHAASARDLFNADAYGSFAFVGESVMSGRTSLVTIGCQAKPGMHVENTMQNNQEEEQNTGGSMSTGSVRTAADAIKSSRTTKSLSTSIASAVNLLRGRITASRVRAVSSTFTAGTEVHTSSGGTVLSDLVVDGEAYRVEPGPNTRVTLDGVGYVVLNEQFSNLQATRPFLTVNGIHVYVTQANAVGIPLGTQYIVAHATSALKPGVSGVLAGTAFGHKMFEGNRMQSGPSAAVYMPCEGTGGKTVENSSGRVQQPQVLELGAVRTTGIGRLSLTRAASVMRSSVDSVNLLSGLITADSVTARARAAKDGNALALSDVGSRFVNLVVAGRPIGAVVAPNTPIDLPGLGTLWLHRVVREANSIEVRMIELVVKDANPFGLSPGSKLQLAVAQAAILP